MTEEKTDLIVADAGPLEPYAILSAPAEKRARMQRTLEKNLGEGTKLAVHNLPEIKVPSGGGKAWELPGTEEPVMTVDGVILAKIPTRVFWEGEFGEAEQEAPACKSDDGKTGQMREDYKNKAITLECSTCPLSQWNDNEPPKCSQRTTLVLLRPSTRLRLARINLPPGSIKNLKDYMYHLTLSEGLAFSECVTRLGLEQAKSEYTAKNITYSKATFELVAPVDDDHVDILETLAESF